MQVVKKVNQGLRVKIGEVDGRIKELSEKKGIL